MFVFEMLVILMERRAWTNAKESHLDVKKVPNVEADRRAVNGRVVVDSSVIANVRSHSESYRLRLQVETKENVSFT